MTTIKVKERIMANTQLCDATHVLAYIAINNKSQVKSAQIAESLQTAPSLVRRIMSRLSKAGLINTVQGATQPMLSRPANKISLLDIYLALDEHPELLKIDQHTSPDCPIGKQIPTIVHHYYDEIQNAAQAKMAVISLQDIVSDIKLSRKQSIAETQ
ncbi:MAG: Rrf2 family transcriptional regulator [Oenococcus sp.]